MSESEGSAGRMAAVRLKDLAENLLSESKRPSTCRRLLEGVFHGLDAQIMHI